MALARRVRVGGGAVLLPVLVHLVASLVTAFVHLGVVGTIFYHTHGHHVLPGPVAQVRTLVAGYLPLDVLSYWMVLGGDYAAFLTDGRKLRVSRNYRGALLAAQR